MHTQIEQTIDQLVVHLQNEGILDEQFHQLMQLQDETNPVSKLTKLHMEPFFPLIP